MAEPKTTKTDASVAEFLDAVADPARRADARALCELITKATGATPVMWGTAIVGFGSYRYTYASGRKGDWPAVGFSPRRQALTVYLSEGFDGYADLLGKLGPHSIGKSCLYVKRLADVDAKVLTELVRSGYHHLNGTVLAP
ncbi:hypothetical protein GCM10009682_47700 [Luedemannella flava]|uniref:YdhG-like domain-containing protein n=1 Tax=Luedemannella flava TaxID=349316 RepID=A0ABN2MDC9_9ACTN